jgi:predicted O-methyltransferase YrrM
MRQVIHGRWNTKANHHHVETTNTTRSRLNVRFNAMNAQIRNTLDELERFMAGTDDALALPREAASFVHALILARGAQHVVEIGTSYGYSGIWIAAALAETGGCLISVDRDVGKTEAARENFASAGLTEIVQLRHGEAVEVLSSLAGPIDFVLNDADKENCVRYIEMLAPKLVPGAVVLTDNTITHAAELSVYLRWIREHRDFYSTPVSIGNGMELSVKLPSSGEPA